MTKRQQEEISKFIEDTNSIINLLTDWQIEKMKGKKFTEMQISNKWREFAIMWNRAKREGIDSNEIVRVQCKDVVRSFRFFKDTLRIFKNLPEY